MDSVFKFSCSVSPFSISVHSLYPNYLCWVIKSQRENTCILPGKGRAPRCSGPWCFLQVSESSKTHREETHSTAGDSGNKTRSQEMPAGMLSAPRASCLFLMPLKNKCPLPRPERQPPSHVGKLVSPSELGPIVSGPM